MYDYRYGNISMSEHGKKSPKRLESTVTWKSNSKNAGNLKKYVTL